MVGEKQIKQYFRNPFQRFVLPCAGQERIHAASKVQTMGFMEKGKKGEAIHVSYHFCSV